MPLSLFETMVGKTGTGKTDKLCALLRLIYWANETIY